MTTWDYAQLSHLAKELGGPQALISNIRAGGISVGRIQGGVIGSVATLVAGGIGLYAYDKHQRKIALAEQSATMLKANIEVYEEAHSSTEVDEATRETQHSEEETVTESSGIPASLQCFRMASTKRRRGLATRFIRQPLPRGAPVCTRAPIRSYTLQRILRSLGTCSRAGRPLRPAHPTAIAGSRCRTGRAHRGA